MLKCIKCNTTLIGKWGTDMVYIGNKCLYPGPSKGVISYTFGRRVYGIQFGVYIGTPLMKRQTWNDHSTISHAWKLYTKKVEVWFNFREDITDLEVCRCKLLSNGNVNVYF